MREKIIYVAYDGKEFEDQYSCEIHDNEVTEQRLAIIGNITFYKNGEEIEFPSVMDENWEEEIETFYDDCDSIKVFPPYTKEFYECCRYNWGCSEICDLPKGKYVYDWNNFQWVPAE